MSRESIGQEIFNLLTPVQKIKFLPRQGWVQRGFESDSIASHSYDTMFIGMFLARSEDVDENKVLKILMIHDLVMGYMEDVTPNSGKYGNKRDLEEIAFQQVIKITPDILKEEYQKNWDEFQAGCTDIAIIAREADKLATLYQALFFQEKYKVDVLNEFLQTYKSIFKTQSSKSIIKFLEKQSFGE